MLWLRCWRFSEANETREVSEKQLRRELYVNTGTRLLSEWSDDESVEQLDVLQSRKCLKMNAEATGSTSSLTDKERYASRSRSGFAEATCAGWLWVCLLLSVLYFAFFEVDLHGIRSRAC
ncbi:unnamed protein product [Soboliphyme baturini]|uniref:Uncharacterized protein n=1 Tax=Soboliphyme baturini TaxID=241478 RepID=A0A183J2W9_9BILA|nr:unnamed protein product [Soboliphyme baturini]